MKSDDQRLGACQTSCLCSGDGITGAHTPWEAGTVRCEPQSVRGDDLALSFQKHRG